MLSHKSPSALKTIGEVSQQLGIASHVLRFWEDKFSQVKPQKRRGRRYYSVKDVEALQTIKTLLYDEGYTIKGVKKFLSDKKKSPQQKVEQEFSTDLFGNSLGNDNDSSNKQLLQIYDAIMVAKKKLEDC